MVSLKRAVYHVTLGEHILLWAIASGPPNREAISCCTRKQTAAGRISTDNPANESTFVTFHEKSTFSRNSSRHLYTQFPIQGQLLYINMQQFRGGLAIKARRPCVSLNTRLESKKKEEKKFVYKTCLFMVLVQHLGEELCDSTSSSTFDLRA